MSAEVDLVVNCYERTYRDVLAPGTVARIVDDNRFRFARRTALINNVDDREAAAAAAAARIADGELDAFFFVDEHLDRALEITGLRREDLEPIPYFTDWAIVAATLPGPPWLVHWDAEVHLREPVDWIAPSTAFMDADPRVLVANPLWTAPTLRQTTIAWAGAFALGHGLSDQVFLARRRELAAPIYGERCLARLRYPLAHVGEIFEAMVDSWMRHNGRLRATYLPAVYVHPENMGVAYPARSLAQTVRYARNLLVTRALLAAPQRLRPRCARYL